MNRQQRTTNLVTGVPSESFDPVLSKFWDLDAGRLADMDRMGIERSILSCFNYGSVQLDPDVGRAVQMAGRMNDGLADRIAKRPDRFSGFAALPLQDPGPAVAEFRRCVTELGFVGAMVNGHTGGRSTRSTTTCVPTCSSRLAATCHR